MAWSAHCKQATPRFASSAGSKTQPLLATLTAASIRGRVATGPRAGQRLRRRLTDPAEGHRTGPLGEAARGFSLHAATRIPAGDRERLEHLCRYLLRPPLAAVRRRWLDPQTLAFSLKTPWDDGTTALVVSPHELLERLAPTGDRPTSGRALGRLPWVRLLARVFRLELRCPACGGPLRLIAALTAPDSIRTYLDGVGLDSRLPPIAPARLGAQLKFDCTA